MQQNCKTEFQVMFVIRHMTASGLTLVEITSGVAMLFESAREEE